MKYVLIKSTVEYQRNDRVIVRVKKEFFRALIQKVKKNKVAVLLDTGAEITIPMNKVKGFTSKKRNPKPIPKDKVEKKLKKKRITGIDKEDKETKIRKVSGKKSKKININRLKQDPDKYIPGLNVKQIVKIMDNAADYYYNTGKILISDEVFDKLENELREREPGHPRLKKVRAPIRTTMEKVNLPYYMPSLDKLKPDNNSIEKWTFKFEGPYLVMDKMDGVSLLIDGKSNSWKLYTSGDGKIGQDLSYLAPFLKLPKPKSGITVRAEIEIKDSAFKALKSKDANPRSTVSGITTSKKVDGKKLKSTDIIAYELINPVLKPSDQMKKLKSLGFKVVKHKIVDNIDAGTLSKFFETRKGKSDHAIDGLVISQDTRHTRTTSGNPEYSKAFKMNIAENIVNVVVKEVLWRPSKWGFLKPRIKIKPVTLSGVKITYATGFNAKFIRENSIGPGAIVKLVRSGDVIPHVLEVLKPAKKPQMPDRDYEWTDTEVDIYLPGKEQSNTVKIKFISSFFKTIGVEDFSGGLVSKLYEDGLDTIMKIVKADKKRLLTIPGIKDKLATKITEGIKKRLSQVELHKLMFASGEFGRDLGSRRIKLVLKDYPNVLTADWGEKKLRQKLLQVPGFSTKLSNYFVQGLPKFQSFLKKIRPYIKIVKPQKIKRTSSSLRGQKICFTGFRNKELEKSIEQAGGQHGNMSKDTTILLVKDLYSTTKKMQKARELGAKIMTEDKFRTMFSL